jgi:hypothetical protein
LSTSQPPSPACLGFAFTVNQATLNNFIEWSSETKTLNVSPTILDTIGPNVVSFTYGTTANPQLGMVDVVMEVQAF